MRLEHVGVHLVNVASPARTIMQTITQSQQHSPNNANWDLQRRSETVQVASMTVYSGGASTGVQIALCACTNEDIRAHAGAPPEFERRPSGSPAPSAAALDVSDAHEAIAAPAGVRPAGIRVRPLQGQSFLCGLEKSKCPYSHRNVASDASCTATASSAGCKSQRRLGEVAPHSCRKWPTPVGAQIRERTAPW